jgi:TolB-like protein/DNA-binding winged helix-turn-helix (wHTH) protein/Tfp pilus assembly protein PilF
MGPAVPPPRTLRFGVFEINVRSGELSKQGRKVRLEGQPVQILLCLLENPGELVTRDELRQRLWPADTFVNFEHGLNAAVKRLRQALNDSAGNPRFVETLPRRGYRFLAPVQIVNAAEEGPNQIDIPPAEMASGAADLPKAKGGLRSPFWKRSGWALLVVLVGVMAWMLRPKNAASPVIRSLAVLPLENLSHDPSQDYFADGMTDELITELGQISELRVISRTSAMTYKGAHKSVPQIAGELNVDAVIEGTVLRSGDQVRITAQLIQAPADKQLWAQSYEGDVRHTLGLQRQVARAIAEAIQVELTAHERDVLKSVKAVNSDAYEAYLKGRYFWNKRTADGMKEAISYFSRAIEMDPNYAPAYAGLADSYALAGDWKYGVLAPKDAYPKAKAAALKAIELDGALGEAHISLAVCLDGYDWDFDAAGKEFTRGIELSPSYATGHEWYGWHLASLGRSGEALAQVKKAENLDPLSLIISSDLAEELLIAHRYDEAAKQTQKAINMDHFFAPAHYVMGATFVQEHRYDEAIAELRKATELSEGSTAFNANLAYAYAVSGRSSEAVRILTDLRNQLQHGFANAPEIALVYVGLGDKDQAMAWLNKAFDERFSPWVLMRPAFDPLRSDPRFQDLLHRIGLSN